MPLRHGKTLQIPRDIYIRLGLEIDIVPFLSDTLIP